MSALADAARVLDETTERLAAALGSRDLDGAAALLAQRGRLLARLVRDEEQAPDVERRRLLRAAAAADRALRRSAEGVRDELHREIERLGRLRRALDALRAEAAPPARFVSRRA